MDRGRLLTPREVVARYFPPAEGERPVTPRWVVEHVTPAVRLSKTRIRFHEKDVEGWLETRRAA